MQSLLSEFTMNPRPHPRLQVPLLPARTPVHGLQPVAPLLSINKRWSPGAWVFGSCPGGHIKHTPPTPYLFL